MKITLQKLSGEPLEFEVDPSSTLGSFKDEISQTDPRRYWGVLITLLFEGLLFDASYDSDSLENCGLVDGSTVMLIKQALPMVLTTSADKTARVWNANTGRCLQTYAGHTNQVNSAVFSTDGLSVLTASSDHTARLWNAVDASCLRKFSGHTQAVNSAAISADSSSVLTASSDKTSKLWSASSGRCRRTFSGHKHVVSSVRLSVDEAFVLTASWDKTAKIWDIASAKCLQTFAHTGHVNSAEYSPDGLSVLTSCDRAVKLWNVTDGSCTQNFFEHDKNVSSAVICADGVTMVSSSFDCRVKIWSIATGKKEAFANLESLRHDREVHSAMPSLDGGSIVTTCGDNTARLWQLSESSGWTCNQIFHGHLGTVNSAVFSVDPSKATASLDSSKARADSSHSEEADDALFLMDATKVATILDSTIPQATDLHSDKGDSSEHQTIVAANLDSTTARAATVLSEKADSSKGPSKAAASLDSTMARGESGQSVVHDIDGGDEDTGNWCWEETAEEETQSDLDSIVEPDDDLGIVKHKASSLVEPTEAIASLDGTTARAA